MSLKSVMIFAAAVSALAASAVTPAAANGSYYHPSSFNLAHGASCGGGHTYGGGSTTNVNVYKPVTINKNVNVYKPVTVNKNLNVYKPVTINKNLTVNKNISVYKPVTINKDINVVNNIDNSKNIDIDKTYNITKNIDNSKNINIDKTINANKNIDINKNVNINKNITINKGGSGEAMAEAMAWASAQASASASANVTVYNGGGYQDVTVINHGNVGGAIGVHAEEACQVQVASVVKAIHAVCVAGGREFPASHMLADTWISNSYEGEVARCIPGAHLKVTIGDVLQSDQGMAGTYQDGQVLVCSADEALRHYKDGMLKCVRKVPVKDCTERTNLRRYGTGDLFFSYRAQVCVQGAHTAAARSVELEGMTMDGGVGAEEGY